jgi:hypothetical protein
MFATKDHVNLHLISIDENYFRYNEEPTFIRGPGVRFVTNAKEY